MKQSIQNPSAHHAEGSTKPALLPLSMVHRHRHSAGWAVPKNGCSCTTPFHGIKEHEHPNTPWITLRGATDRDIGFHPIHSIPCNSLAQWDCPCASHRVDNSTAAARNIRACSRIYRHLLVQRPLLRGITSQMHNHKVRDLQINDLKSWYSMCLWTLTLTNQFNCSTPSLHFFWTFHSRSRAV